MTDTDSRWKLLGIIAAVLSLLAMWDKRVNRPMLLICALCGAGITVAISWPIPSGPEGDDSNPAFYAIILGLLMGFIAVIALVHSILTSPSARNEPGHGV